MDLSTIPPLNLLLILGEIILVPILIVWAVYVWYVSPFRHGLQKQRKRDWAGAERDYTKMLQRNPRFWKARHNRVMVRMENNQPEGLLDEENKVLQQKPRFAGAHLVRAEIYLNLNQREQAAAGYQKVLTLRGNRKVKATAYARLSAMKLYDYEFVSKSPDDPARKSLVAEAEAFADASLRLDNHEIAFVSKANIFRIRGDLQGALRVYEDALRLMPDSVLMRTTRSSIYVAQENYAAAIADCNQALSLSGGKYMFAYNNRAYARALRGELEASLEDCNQALKLAPKYFYAYGSRGFTYFLMGRLDEALVDFQQALKLAPQHDYGMAGTAITLHALGRIDEAKDQWRALIELNPQYRNVDKIKEEYKHSPAFEEAALKIVASLEE